MFSPAEELHETEAVMMRNMQAMQAGSGSGGDGAGSSCSGRRPCCFANRPAAARLDASILA